MTSSVTGAVSHKVVSEDMTSCAFAEKTPQSSSRPGRVFRSMPGRMCGSKLQRFRDFGNRLPEGIPPCFLTRICGTRDQLLSSGVAKS